MPDGETNTHQESYEYQREGDQTRKYPVVTAQNTYLQEQQQQTRQDSSKSGPLQRFAERQAVQDALRIEEYVESGQYITIDSRRLTRRVRDFAERDISNEFLRDDSAPGYEVLLAEYEQAYRRKLQEKIQPYGDRITFLKEEKEQRLRNKLSQDRALVKTRAPGDGHARDLVLTRILQIYYWDQLEKVDIEVLLKHHALIDRYEKFVSDSESRNEVTWPENSPRNEVTWSANSFRP